MKVGDLDKQPKWVRELVAKLRTEREDLERRMLRLEQAHEILNKRDWFAIYGERNPKIPEGEMRRVWIINRDDPYPVCSIGYNDVLLIGRARK